jgi:hypothetical protein
MVGRPPFASLPLTCAHRLLRLGLLLCGREFPAIPTYCDERACPVHRSRDGPCRWYEIYWSDNDDTPSGILLASTSVASWFAAYKHLMWARTRALPMRLTPSCVGRGKDGRLFLAERMRTIDCSSLALKRVPVRPHAHAHRRTDH